MPYQFFFSYASANRTKFLNKFLSELKQLVRDKTGVPEEEVGFFAPEDIKTGEQWQQSLGHGLRTSKVIVCVCTPGYFNSLYCGKELGVFLLRRESFRLQGNEHRKAAVVIPVVWEWPLGGALHHAFEPFQYKDDDLPELYVKNGLNAVLRQRREAQFQKVAITIADRIRDAIQDADLPEWPALPPFDQIESIFHAQADGARYQYGVGFLHPQGASWKPFAGGPGLYEFCDRVSAQTNRLCRPHLAGADFIEKLREAAARRESVVVVTDLGTAESAGAGLLKELDEAAMSHVALFVLPDETTRDAQSAAVERLRAAVPKMFAQAVPHNWLSIRTADGLSRALVDTLVKVGTTLLKSDDARRVQNSDLGRRALEDGIQTENAPVLGGPGRSA